MVTIGRIGVILVLGALLTISACSANSGSSNQTASAAGTGNKAGCEVDAKKVCQQFSDKPKVIDSTTGLVLEGHALEESGRRTVSMFRTYQIPNGPVIEVDCDVNVQHNSVVYAHTTHLPPLSDSDIQYLRSNSLCAE